MTNIDRTIAPEVKTIKELKLREPEQIVFPNNNSCFLWHDDKNELLKIDIVIAAGSIAQKKTMTAYFTSKLLKEGNQTKSSSKIADIIDFHGAHMEFQVDKDEMTATLFCLKKHAEKLIPLFSETLYQPIFPEEEITQLKTIEKAKLSINTEKMEYLTAIRFNQEVFGQEHPYGWTPSIEAIESIERKNIIDFHQENILQKNADIYVSGAYDDEIIQFLEKHFGKQIITKKETSQNTPFLLAASADSQILQEKPNAIQSAIRIGNTTINKTHPDHFYLYFTTVLLGGYFGSRLMKKIREEKGYTYGIGSLYQTLKDSGVFLIATQVNNKYTADTIKCIFEEMERLKKESISTEELNTVKAYINGSLLRKFDSVFSLTKLYEKNRLHGLNLSYFSSLMSKTNTIDTKTINAIAAKYFDKNQLKIVISGNLK